MRAPSLHHLLRRQNAPEIGRRGILRPHLRPLRAVAVPGPRLEIAELLVDLVELREQLGDQPVGPAVIGEEVVADAVPARAPDELVAVEAEKIAGGLQMAPIAQLERRVEMP